MSRIIAAIGRKTLGLALIFNSIVSLTSAANILASLYIGNFMWQPYAPYLINGSLFWFVILTAFLNIAPAMFVGRVNIRRIVFHHYVYGLLSIFTSLFLVALYSPAYILLLLIPSLGFQVNGFSNIATYVGIFFVYGGLTLVIDDIHDVSLRMAGAFDKIKLKARNLGKSLEAIHLCSSLISVYVTTCIPLWYLENSLLVRSWPLWDLANILFMLNLFITSIWGLKVVKEKLWFMKILTDLPKKRNSNS